MPPCRRWLRPASPPPSSSQGKRYMLPHATAMLHQPRVPSSGQRQATEIQIKWKEVLAQKKVYLDVLSKTTGQSEEKLDRDMQRPLYMQPADAVAYGVIDKVRGGGRGGGPAACLGKVAVPCEPAGSILEKSECGQECAGRTPASL